ncbi:hypothetical protein Tco_0581390 [Tanacetum coccineum]
MGIAEDVVVRVDGFTFLADFVVVNFVTKQREAIIFRKKKFVHAISIIDFSKDDPFSGSTTIPSDAPFPSSSPMKTSIDSYFRGCHVEIKSSPSFTLTSPKESELIWEEFEAYLEGDSIPPGTDLNLPPTLEVSSSNPTSYTSLLQRGKDLFA